jgi:fibronectin-binding autotransporter adhesin
MPAWADLAEWTGATSGNWYEPTNWSPTQLPDDDTDVVIDTIQPFPLIEAAGNPPDARSRILTVGNQNFGALTIDGGGVLHSSVGILAQSPGSQASMAVGRDDSRWHVAGSVDVGALGSALIELFQGGQITSTHVRIGDSLEAVGTLVVGDTGSLWTIHGTLSIGRFARGNATIRNGGRVSVTTPHQAHVGHLSGGAGTLTIEDADSELAVELLRVGSAGSGELLLASGGKILSTEGSIGSSGSGEGSVLIIGNGSEWDNQNLLVVGESGSATGELTVRAGGIARVQSGFLRIGDSVDSEGTVNVGTAAEDSPAPAGLLLAQEIRMGPGQATLVFNHDAGNHVLGVPLRGSGLVRALAGTTRLSADSPLFSGQFDVSGGSLIVDGTVALEGLLVSGGGTLSGSGHADGAVHVDDGVLVPGGSPGVFGTGDLVLGPASILRFELGAPGSPDGSDRVDVEGDLVLAGQLEVLALDGFDEGVYRLFNYSGALTDLGLTITSLPSGYGPAVSFVDISGAGQVDLVVVADPTIFADGFEAKD